MTLELHPLSTLFPAMSDEQITALLDGVLPMDQKQIDAVIASDWFKGLKASQRAAYVAVWSHMLEVGSNQHKRRVSTRTVRFAAEAAVSAIGRAAA